MFPLDLPENRFSLGSHTIWIAGLQSSHQQQHRRYRLLNNALLCRELRDCPIVTALDGVAQPVAPWIRISQLARFAITPLSRETFPAEAWRFV